MIKPTTMGARTYGVSLLLFTAFSTAPAQFAPKATPADSDLVTTRVLETSFRGITLHPAEQSIARTVIKRAFLKTIALDPYGPLEVYDTLFDRRDSLLLRLIHTRADSSRYLRNSEPLRPPRRNKVVM